MVKSTGITRKVDELGRVVLPIEIRKLLGIVEKDSVDILVDEEAEYIILRKANKYCLKCQTTDNLKEVKPGCYLCDSCIDSLK